MGKKANTKVSGYFQEHIGFFLQSRMYHFRQGKVYLSASWLPRVVLIPALGGYSDSASTLDKPFSLSSV